MARILAIIMAGGKGERLSPLTRDRSKPSVPFGGTYRLVDITLSNCINSGIYKIMVLPQYKSQSLVDHLEAGWNIFSFALGHYLRIVSPQMRLGESWYRGTADSVRHNAYLLERDESISDVLILSGDHVCKMNYNLFARYHKRFGADVTISVVEVDREQAKDYGVVQVNPEFSIQGFMEKPSNPPPIPGDEGHALASMGIYIFKKRVLLKILKDMPGMDFGHDIIPALLGRYKVRAYPYRAHNVISDYTFVTKKNGQRVKVRTKCMPDSGYWRDVGNLDAYWNANMDLCGTNPFFNLYGQLWPIRTYQRQFPPAKFVHSQESFNSTRVGKALDSLVGQGCIISGAVVRNSVLSTNVVVQSWSEVDESVIMDNVIIGRNCQVKKAIIDKQNHLPQGEKIGLNPLEDRKRFKVTERGITVVPKGYFKP
ncbi:glucose-1-phosphate adenylyltransferase [Dethiosulfatarculus sandiegensis]|uniref:Glucose-1-phosphate adenylyltransferase n=1 Tax=Dethiosulfatarculus sandiegensis TaxID=1429043 RepID=A0A0D2J426_9BACT|nr:glucose-1-phosphate adenylyltransferase [Dethiosulfatarculus sandiegensis]KIX12909.1 glucose-1-phosphate adenylyltransferase [Dethiosulfatarculus sandiegensis]